MPTDPENFRSRTISYGEKSLGQEKCGYTHRHTDTHTNGHAELSIIDRSTSYSENSKHGFALCDFSQSAVKGQFSDF